MRGLLGLSNLAGLAAPAIRPAVWTPAMLGSSLLAWWTADRADLITLAVAAVTSWRDVVAGYDAVQAVALNQPLYSATSFNGSPGITFDGLTDELTCTDAALLALLPDGAEPGELWGLAQQNALAADATTRILMSYGNGTNVCRRLTRTVASGSNRMRGQVGTGAASVTPTNTSVDFTGRHVARMAVGAAATTVTVDAEGPASLAAVPATTATRLRLGASDTTSASSFWSGIGRDYLVTLPLSEDQSDHLNSYLLARR